MVKSSVIYTNISPIMVLSATICKSIFFLIYKTTYLAHCLCMVWSNFLFFKGLSVYPFKTLCLLYLSFCLFIVLQITINCLPNSQYWTVMTESVMQKL
jgi:hypothetical protein